MAIYCIDYTNGVNSPGGGTAVAPYKTIEYLESQVTLAAGDEIRIAGSDLDPTEYTATTVSVTSGTIALSSVAGLAVNDTLWIPEGTVNSGPMFVRIKSFNGNIITIVGNDYTTGEPRVMYSLANADSNFTVRKVTNPVNIVTASSTLQYNDRVAITTNYGFSNNTISVTISGGWNPANFTELTALGYTVYNQATGSAYQYQSRFLTGQAFRVGYINGFKFENFAFSNQTPLVFNNTTARGVAHLNNMIHTWPQAWSSSAFYADSNTVYNVTWDNLQVGMGIGFANGSISGFSSSNGSVIKYKNTKYYSKTTQLTSNFGGYTVLNFTAYEGSIYVKGGNGAGISRIYGRSLTDNVPLDLTVMSGCTKFLWQSYLGTVFTASQEQGTVPSSIKTKIEGIVGTEASAMPMELYYDGNLLQDFITPMVNTSSNSPNSASTVYGQYPAGCKVIDNTGELYPAGWGMYRFNTTDQLTGTNCIEWIPMFQNASNQILGLDYITIEPGQTFNATMKAKLKPGGAQATGAANLAINGVSNFQLYQNYYGFTSTSAGGLQQGNPVTLNQTTWQDITMTYTNTTNLRLYFLFGIRPPYSSGFGNFPSTSRTLIDSFSYTIS